MIEEIQENSTDDEPKLLWPLYLVAIGIFVVAVPFLFQFWNNPFSSDPDEWSEFSTYFGDLISPVIAFSVLMYVYNTFKVQRKELNATKIALEESKSEQIKQTKIMGVEARVRILQYENTLLWEQYNNYMKLLDDLNESHEKLVMTIIRYQKAGRMEDKKRMEGHKTQNEKDFEEAGEAMNAVGERLDYIKEKMQNSSDDLNELLP